MYTFLDFPRLSKRTRISFTFPGRNFICVIQNDRMNKFSFLAFQSSLFIFLYKFRVGLFGDLVMVADLASPPSIAFMIINGSGIISVGMKEDLERMMIPMMCPVMKIGYISAAASTVTVMRVWCLKA